MAFVITQPCIGVKDASCVDVCPVNCIKSDEGSEQYFINPAVCTNCNYCEPVCPAQAIFDGYGVPAQWDGFILLNKQYFA
ncbi:MAG TPA: 4Fe-4S ferredoxin [Dehalococcoidia bacterium]|nr:4Fe-4S ferredoxin [Dehalococcoidia bacterium]